MSYLFYPNIPYGTSPLQYVNIYQYTAAAPRGTIFRIHGGSWRSSTSDVPTGSESPDIVSIVNQGYTVVDINYRGWNDGGNGQFPNSVTDIKTVLQFSFEANAGAAFSTAWQNMYTYLGANGRPMVTGSSAGGHLAVMAVCSYGTSSGNWPRAVAVQSAPLNVDYTQIFVDTLVQGAVINNYITSTGQLDDASPFYQYGTLSSPGPWFTAVNNAPCKFYFKHNKRDTLVTWGAMGSPTIENFKLYNSNKTTVVYEEVGPPLGSWPGTSHVTDLGPVANTASLPGSGSPGDAYFVSDLATYWVYNNGSYPGDSVNPASVNGFTRWFDHNSTSTEADFITTAAVELLGSERSSIFVIDSNDNKTSNSELIISAFAEAIPGFENNSQYWRTTSANITSNTVSYPSGDVKFWFVAGQSNAANVGIMNGAFLQYRYESGNVYQYWSPSLYTGISPLRGGSGPDGWNSFQKVAVDYCRNNPGTSVIISCFGVSGRPISEFASGGNLHTYMVNQLSGFKNYCTSVSGKAKIDYFLWQQGESDAILGTSSSTYQTAFSSIATAVLPYVTNIRVARSSYYDIPGTWTYNNPTGQALDTIRSTYPGPDTDTLTGLTNRPDGIHFGNQGTLNMSILWNQYL